MLLDILYRLHAVAPLLALSHLLTEVADAGLEAVPQERLQHDLRRLMQLFLQITNLEEAYPLFRGIVLAMIKLSRESRDTE